MYCIKDGYHHRSEPVYFEDVQPAPNLVYQPEVYAAAETLARRTGARRIVDLGCGHAGKLVPLFGQFEISGFDFGANLEYCRAEYGAVEGTEWRELDLEQPCDALVESGVLDDAVIICADVVEHIARPDNLLKLLVEAHRRGHFVLMSTPERDLTRGFDDMGPPENTAHIREWNYAEFAALLAERELASALVGITINDTRRRQRNTLFVVGSERYIPSPAHTPPQTPCK